MVSWVGSFDSACRGASDAADAGRIGASLGPWGERRDSGEIQRYRGGFSMDRVDRGCAVFVSSRRVEWARVRDDRSCFGDGNSLLRRFSPWMGGGWGWKKCDFAAAAPIQL
jgi:hypothetical protein